MKPSILAALLFCPAAQAATLVVDDQPFPPVGTYPSLAAAVAASSSGDTIEIVSLVAPSVVDLDIDWNLTLIGMGPRDQFHVPRLHFQPTVSSASVTSVSLSCEVDWLAAIITAGAMSLTLDDVVSDCPGAGQHNGFASTGGTHLIVRDSEFVGSGVHIENRVFGTTLIEGCHFTDVTAGNATKALDIQGASYMQTSLTVRQTTITNMGDLGTNGAAIDLSYGDLILEDSTISHSQGGTTGAVRVVDGDAQITDSTFTNNLANEGGALHLTNGSFTIERSVFSENEAVAGDGGAILAVTGIVPTLTVRDSTFTANSAAGSGGSVSALADGGIATFTGNEFCGDDAVIGGASLNIESGTDTILDGVVVAMPVSSTPAVSVAAHDNDLIVFNSTLIGTLDNAIEVYGSGYNVQVHEVLFHDIVGIGVATVDDLSLGVPWGYGAYNNWFDMMGVNAQGILTPGNFSSSETMVDPMFSNYIDRNTTTCAAMNLWLDAASPMRDAGVRVDHDGSVSDIGAYGGPQALLADADLDGIYEDLDCDDSDASIFPGGPDTWYDGIDQNCDGVDDYDQDGDGHASDAHGGTDCDDLDDTIHPDATDLPTDGIDQDCDGGDGSNNTSTTGTTGSGTTDTTSVTGPTQSADDKLGSSCSISTGTPTGPAGLLLASLVLLRRRRS